MEVPFDFIVLQTKAYPDFKCHDGSWPMQYIGTVRVNGEFADYYVDFDYAGNGSENCWCPFVHWYRNGRREATCIDRARNNSGIDAEEPFYQVGKRLVLDMWWYCFQKPVLVELGNKNRVIKCLQPFVQET